MPSEIHALMQYAHDIDARRSHSIEDHVRFDGMSVIARADCFAGAVTPWVFRNLLDASPESAKVFLRLIFSPVFGTIIPNCLEIGLGARR